MSGINGVTVVFKGVYGCVTVALVRKLPEFYGCVTVIYLIHALVYRIWMPHFSILIIIFEAIYLLYKTLNLVHCNKSCNVITIPKE